MFRKLVLCLLLASFTLALVSPASAFDGKRKGFMLGFGIGGGLSSYTQKITQKFEIGSYETYEISESFPRQNDFAFRTDFRIGFGLSENVQLYWMSKVNWFGRKSTFTHNETVASGVGGLGVTYLLKPVDPSPYLVGGFGFSSWSLPFESGSDAWYGFGLTVGAGYQFANHLALEGSLIWGEPSSTERGTKISSNAVGIGVTVNYIAF